MEQELQFGAIEIRSNCKYCGYPIMINGPVDQVLCHTCQRNNQIPQKDMVGILQRLFSEWEENRIEHKVTAMGQINSTYWIGREEPFCEKCKTTFPQSVLSLPEGESTATIFCGNCGKETLVSRPPDWLKNKFQDLELLINAELMEPDGYQEVSEKIEGVVFNCPKCGAGLDIDGSERIIFCEHCENRVFIPDSLWLRLHPVKTMDKWFLARSKPVQS